MILRLPHLIIYILATASVGAYSSRHSPRQRPQFNAGRTAHTGNEKKSHHDDVVRRRRRGGLPLRAIADETDVRSRRAAVVAAGVAQAEKAAEAALAASRRRGSGSGHVVDAATLEEGGRSPGFVGFRPREATIDERNARRDVGDDGGVDQLRRRRERQEEEDQIARPAVTIRPGPGVTITRTLGNVIVASDDVDDNKGRMPDESSDSPPPSLAADDGDVAEESPTSEAAVQAGNDSAAARSAAAALLRRKVMNQRGARSNTKVGRTKTSVGRLKSGSARRTGGTVAGRLLGAVRTGAAAAAAARQKKNESNGGGGGSGGGDGSSGDSNTMSAAPTRPTKSLIESTVNDLMRKQEDRRASVVASNSNHYETQASAMGLFGEPMSVTSTSTSQTPQHMFDAQLKHERAFHNYISHWQPPHSGSILLHSESNIQNNPANSDAEYFAAVRDQIAVRVATPWDDIDIASLRLSVFSDFTTDLREKFCQKSCEVLDHRRNKGATCLVAAIDRSMRDTIIARNTYQDGADYGLAAQSRDPTGSSHWFMGSVECSVHEFFGTELGRRRAPGTLLYITEVAVLPEARRTGAATRLMVGVDELATAKGIESLYLHVDVNNRAAITLYEKAGYRIIGKDDHHHELGLEFTTRLNLHDGATKGRNHYLMEKHLIDSPTWFEEADEAVAARKLEEARALQQARAERAQAHSSRASIGFDVPIHYNGRL